MKENKNRIDWTKHDHKLGTKSDRALSLELGCNPDTVARRRRYKKIQAFGVNCSTKRKNSPFYNDLEQKEFKVGGLYILRPKRLGSPAESAEKAGRLPIVFRYVEKTSGCRMPLHVFRSETGGYAETFTDTQILNYRIEEVSA